MYGSRASNKKRSVRPSPTRVAVSMLPLSRCGQARLPPRPKDETRSLTRILLGGKPGHTTPLDIGRELGYFLMRRNSTPFTAGQGRFGLFDCRQNLQPPPLAVFP